MDYKNAGVDIEAGYRSVELMKKHVQGTMRPEVLTNLGGFSGAFSMEKFKDMEKPTLVSGTDGVGTKLKLAFLLDRHDTVGIDCVAMCVNDIACAGGEPLFFLDYIACGKNDPEKIATIVSGVAEGCKQSGAALIGIASSGVHSNGFSLVRKVFSMSKEALDTYYDKLGCTLGEALIAPTKIYVKALKSIKEAGVTVKACSHITGGGFYENIPRMLPDGIRAVVKKDSYPIPPIFGMLAEDGEIEEKVMYNTFNMGLGMVIGVDPADAEKTMEAIRAAGETPYIVGYTEAGEKGVTVC